MPFWLSTEDMHFDFFFYNKNLLVNLLYLIHTSRKTMKTMLVNYIGMPITYKFNIDEKHLEANGKLIIYGMLFKQAITVNFIGDHCNNESFSFSSGYSFRQILGEMPNTSPKG